MPRFIFKAPERVEEPDTHTTWAQEVQEALHQIDVDMSVHDVCAAWEAFSDSMCAGWITHDRMTPEEMLSCIRPYIREL